MHEQQLFALNIQFWNQPIYIELYSVCQNSWAAELWWDDREQIRDHVFSNSSGWSSLQPTPAVFFAFKLLGWSYVSMCVCNCVCPVKSQPYSTNMHNEQWILEEAKSNDEVDENDAVVWGWGRLLTLEKSRFGFSLLCLWRRHQSPSSSSFLLPQGMQIQHLTCLWNPTSTTDAQRRSFLSTKQNSWKILSQIEICAKNNSTPKMVRVALQQC